MPSSPTPPDPPGPPPITDIRPPVPASTGSVFDQLPLSWFGALAVLDILLVAAGLIVRRQRLPQLRLPRSRRADL